MIPHYFPEIQQPAIATWLDAWQQNTLSPAVFALLPEAEKDQLPLIQGLFSERGIRLLGAIFPALLTEAGFQTSGVIFLCFAQAPACFLVDALTTSSHDAAKKIAVAVESALSHRSSAAPPKLFLVFDSMQADLGSILVNLFDQLQQGVSYQGVNAGSESFQPMPCLFDHQRLLSHGAIGLLLDADAEFAVEHGYPVSNSLMRASSTQGNRIDKINGEPAMAEYQRVIAVEFGIALNPENFYDYAVHYPFGLISALDVLVRIPVAFNDDGSIFCVGEIPPNSMLRLLKAPALANSLCVDKLAAGLSPMTGKPLLAFYCAGRRMHFGTDATLEVRALAKQSGCDAIYGALSLGEISTDSRFGLPWFHNAAVVCIGKVRE